MNAPSPITAPVRLAREDKRRLHRKSASWPAVILVATIAAYGVTLVAALAAPALIAIPASLLCGLAIGLLFIVGHDACHQAFTASATANNIIGRLVFLPSLHPYSLWDLGHNRTHHRYNNVRGEDYVWEPMTLAEYRQAPIPTRLAYRLFRSPLGVFLYYGVEIWAKRMVFVLPGRLSDRRRTYWPDLLMVWAFAPIQAALIVWLGSLFGRPAGYSLLLGLVVPFLVWNGLMSFVIYLHHIHPGISWYRSIEDWRAADGRINGTAHVRFPYLVDKLLLHIMKHNAHHYAPGAPLYNLTELQQRVERGGGVSWRWSVGEFLRICRECKLFDYDRGCWRSFDCPSE